MTVVLPASQGDRNHPDARTKIKPASHAEGGQRIALQTMSIPQKASSDLLSVRRTFKHSTQGPERFMNMQ